MEVFQYEINSNELKLNKDYIIRTMGYSKGNIPTEFLSLLDELIEKAHRIIKPRGGFVVLPQNSSSAGNGAVYLNGVKFETYKIVSAPLRKISGAAVFLGTIGEEFDRWSKETFEGGDPLSGYMIDIIGSEFAEAVADLIHEKIKKYANEHGWNASNRYSPGYCGWNVSEQHKLFGFFPKNFCGIQLTESALMRPEKSVSGIIGLSPEIKWIDYPCDVCTFEDCYKNRNKKLKNNKVINF